MVLVQCEVVPVVYDVEAFNCFKGLDKLTRVKSSSSFSLLRCLLFQRAGVILVVLACALSSHSMCNGRAKLCSILQ